MRVAIATDGNMVAPHFGRCQAYTIVDIVNGEVVGRTLVENPGHQPGFLPAFLAERGVNCIIAGGMGPRAQGLFAQYNILTITGVTGPIEQVLEDFINDDLQTGPNICEH